MLETALPEGPVMGPEQPRAQQEPPAFTRRTVQDRTRDRTPSEKPTSSGACLVKQPFLPDNERRYLPMLPRETRLLPAQDNQPTVTSPSRPSGLRHCQRARPLPCLPHHDESQSVATHA